MLQNANGDQISSATPPCLRSLSAGIKDLAMRGMLKAQIHTPFAGLSCARSSSVGIDTLAAVSADPGHHVSTGALAQSGQTALRGRSLVSYELDETVLL
jgi:hypothetical protein